MSQPRNGNSGPGRDYAANGGPRDGYSPGGGSASQYPDAGRGGSGHPGAAERSAGYSRDSGGRAAYRDPNYAGGRNGSDYGRGGGGADYAGGPSNQGGGRAEPPGRRAATGRHGAGDGAASGRGSTPLDDTGAWYRAARDEPRGLRARAAAMTDSRGFRAIADRATAMTRRAARPGYNRDDSLAGPGATSGRYDGAGPYGPERHGGSPRPDELGRFRGGRGPSRGGRRDRRVLYNRDGSPTSPGQRFLRRLWYGRWWRHWSIKKVALLFGGLAATMALVLVAAFFVILNSTKVPIAALSAEPSQSSVVYFSNGRTVGCFCTAGRFNMNEGEVHDSKILVAAVLAAEDRAYFTEGGISIPGLLRAIKNNLSGGSIQGASTITEQFVKTYYNRAGNLSYAQKFNEIFVAIKLAKMEPKWWILTHYLNDIPLGSGANGVEAAAETYFHVKPWQLSVAQAAMIAAMIQSPYGYDPANPTADDPNLGNSLIDRWVYVLTNMVRDGAITQQQMNLLVPDPSHPDTALKNFPKIKQNTLTSNWTGYRGYIMELVAGELQAYYGMGNYSTTELGNLGLQIHTTLNERLMNALYRTITAEKRQMAALAAQGNGSRLPSYVHISAVLESPGTGKILAFYGGPGYGVKDCSWYHCNVDTILTAEPVGSSFKPYVLTTAVNQGMDVQNSVMNSHSPLCIPPADVSTQLRLQLSKQTKTCNTSIGYWLFNESNENYAQNLNVTQATALSNDPAYEDLSHRTGVQSVLDMAARLGVSSYDVAGLNRLFGDRCRSIKGNANSCYPGAVTAALGEGSLSAVDQANTFSVLVSGGKLVTPHVIKSVSQNGVPLVPTHIVHTRALRPAVAADADAALSYDTSCFNGLGCGTGVPNALWNRPMIAKTGTLGSGNSASQAWFVGAIPQYSLAVGMFTDKPNLPNGNPNQILDVLPSLPPWSGGYGGAWPATIWHAFMSSQFNNIAVRPLPVPNYVGFHKWILALPPKKKHKRCQQQHHIFGGHGNGNGKNGGSGGSQCQNGGPTGKGTPSNSPSPHPTTGSPSPHPTTGSPSPHPTGTSTSPNPTVSVTPPGLGAQIMSPPHRGQAPRKTPASPYLTSVAIKPAGLLREPARVVTTSSA